MNRTAMRRRYRPTGPSSDVVEQVLARAGGRCERCGRPHGGYRGVDFAVHHRSPRRMGGTSNVTGNHPENLLVLDTDCHTEVESRRAEALDAGWLVPSGADPARYAVLLHRERWVYLTADYGYSDNPPERAA